MTKEPSATQSNPQSLPRQTRARQTLPKDRRVLKTSQFRQIYDAGVRVPSQCFVAFCWRSPEADGPRIGFTAPRALGKATLRNRMKRRLRETIRRELSRLGPQWRIVWNLRRSALTAPQVQLQAEVIRVFERCKD